MFVKNLFNRNQGGFGIIKHLLTLEQSGLVLI